MSLNSTLRSVTLAAAVCAGASAYALDLPTIDAFVGSGHAIELCHGDLNQQAAHSFCSGIGIAKTSSTQIAIQGFYGGNFDVSMSYLFGKGSLGEGPFPARSVKPDGTPADYAGKYLTIKRVLGINTSLGAFYFNIPDTLGLQQGLNALMNLSTAYSANAYGGHDYTFQAMKVEGELAGTILQAVSSLIPSDGSPIDPETLQQLIATLSDDADISVGAIQLLCADDSLGTKRSKLTTMERYTISSYSANATATDSHDVSRTARARTYPVALTLDRADNSLSILNFSNAGYALADSLYEVTVSKTDTAGNVTTTTRKMLATWTQPIRGTVDWQKGTFRIPSQPMALDISKFNPLSSILGGLTIGEGRLSNARKAVILGWTANTSDPDLTGTFTFTEGGRAHTGSNLWHSSCSGGDLHTVAASRVEMTFAGTYTTAWSGLSLLDASKKVFTSDTRILSEAGGVDVTHDVDILATQLPSFTGLGVNSAHNGEKLEVFGAIAPKTPTDSIDHYEVYLHHTAVSGITTTPLIGNYSAETGLKNSVLLGSVDVPAQGAKADFYYRVPRADIVNNNTKPLFGSKPDIDLGKDHFALFVKAYYKNGLEPTFHALQADLAPLGVSTSVSGIDAASGFTARALPGAIAVTADAPVQIYDLRGRLVCSRLSTLNSQLIVSVAPGVYIVRSGTAACKLLVR